jgi:RNA polymerase sigma-70 factor (ECF subfamily)
MTGLASRQLRLRPWLTTIVLNRCRSVGARRATRGPRPISIEGDADRPAVEPEAPDGATPTAVAERHADVSVGRSGWLPSMAYRTAIVLRHVDGLSYPEAAEALGRPEGTVKAQVPSRDRTATTMLEAESRHEPEEMTA